MTSQPEPQPEPQPERLPWCPLELQIDATLFPPLGHGGPQDMYRITAPMIYVYQLAPGPRRLANQRVTSSSKAREPGKKHW